MRWAVLVGGRGSNLRALLAKNFPVSLVVSHRADAGALQIAKARGIAAVTLVPVAHQSRTEYDTALLDLLREHRIEAIVLAGFMRVLGTPVVAQYRDRMLNVHPSLLPAFPGLHAVQQALNHGVKVAGATVHLVTLGVDEGPIVSQGAVTVEPDDSEATLAARIQQVEHHLLPEAAWALERGQLRVDGRNVRFVEAPIRTANTTSQEDLM